MDVLITALDDSGIRVFGSLRRTTAGGVQVTLPIPLAAQTRVRVRLSEDIHTEGEIASCEKHDSSYYVDVTVAELRREPRFDVNDPAQLTVINVPDYPAVEGRVNNLSKSGLAITMPAAIPAGCQVKVELADGVILGEVKHCKKTGDEYLAGIAVETVLFRDTPSVDRRPETTVARTPGSLWSALKKLYKAVRA